MTDCTFQRFEFQGPAKRPIVASFDGGEIVTEGGAVLLQEVERQTRLVQRFAACFEDHRDVSRVEHSTESLVKQRVLGIALGYEDLNDHDELRKNPLLAAVAGKSDPTGKSRRQARDQGKALAGKSTLHRLEWSVAGKGQDDRYRRMSLDEDAVDAFFVDAFLDSYTKPPKRIILDLDATDDPLHGSQEGRFFHGYYKCYCYLPLYIFCGSHLLCARLRSAKIDASDGSVDELRRIVAQIRERWPEVEIWIRGDSGFARDDIMQWCEENGVEFVLGLARNARLERILDPTMDRARERFSEMGQAVRFFDDFSYRTRKSWSRSRRVIGKAEMLPKGANPRFVVTSLSKKEIEASELYEKVYCARGDMENRIKEQQLYLFATRTSARKMRVNQLRLWFSSLAYLLLDALRRLGLAATTFARAQCHTIRLKLLRIGAHVKVTHRRVKLSLSSSYPYKNLFAHIVSRLQRAGP
jgi:hypothetical protein